MKVEETSKAEYVCNIANNMLTAMEKVFKEAQPSPKGGDMVNAIALASVYMFAKQIRANCNSEKTMQSLMSNVMLVLIGSLKEYSATFIEEPAAWDEYLEEEGGEDGRLESTEL